MLASYTAWFLLVASSVQLGLILTALGRLQFSTNATSIVFIVLAALQTALAGLLFVERSKRLRLEAQNKTAAGTLLEAEAKNAAILSARDLSEKKQTELELQQLSSRLLALQDRERRKLAVELHDITAQNLFAISINLENLRRQCTGMTAAATETFNDCQHLCEQSLQEVRTLSYALHPPALDRLGLIPSLQWYIDGFGRRSGMEIGFIGSKDVGRLPLEMETDIFRIVQEGLSNIVRHSGSRTASVHVRKRAGQFVLQIKDDGRGMTATTREAQNGSGFGVGLPSMRQRVRRWGGHLDIQSEDGGVLLSVELPIPIAESQESAGTELHCSGGYQGVNKS